MSVDFNETNDQAARRLLIESMPLFAVIDAKYAPPCDAPPWAARWVGLHTRWCANFVIDNGPFAGQWAMTPYPVPPTAAEGPVRWVPLAHLHAIEFVSSMSDG